MVSTLKIYEILEEAKIEDRQARAITMAIERAIEKSTEENNANQAQVLATKEDLHKLEVALRKELQNLEVKAADSKAEIIRWMFIFWIGQLAAMVAFLKFFSAH